MPAVDRQRIERDGLVIRTFEPDDAEAAWDLHVEGILDVGGAHYERDEIWSLRKELLHGTGVDSVKFGISVAVLGDRIAVGDYVYDGPQDQGGSVHLFVKRDSIWEERYTSFE